MNPYEQADAARQANREYYRRWREKNRDKVKEYQQRYWAKKGQEYLQNLAETCNKESHAER